MPERRSRVSGSETRENAAGGNRLLTVVTEHEVQDTRADDYVMATHGFFDNNSPVLTDTLERIAGKKLIAPMEWLDY